jgi:phosphopantetheine--protein transferase-like protein
MSDIYLYDFIRCRFGSGRESKPAICKSPPEVFFAETGSLLTILSCLERYISNDEKKRAARFHFTEDRNTYITSHALVRLIISKKLKTDPLLINYIVGKYNKPGLKDDPLFFNLAHTRDAFALAFTSDFPVGIDLEKINRKIDFHSIAKTYFSRKECEFILKHNKGADERFFLLWTRKEALLKALGTGITDHLTKIEVSEQENYIDGDIFDREVAGNEISDHYIYSKKTGNYFMSIAMPCQVSIPCYNLKKETIHSYFC